MADRIVYLVEELTSDHDGSDIEFVDDVALGVLMTQGYEVTNTLPERKVKAHGKTLKASMIMLRRAEDNRGVTARGGRGGDPGYQRDEEGRNVVIVNDEFGMPRSMTPAQATMHAMTKALARVGEVGHLGGARDHNMPGLAIISGEVIGKAWDLGLLAAGRGEPEDTNPFPPGTAPATNWITGYRKYFSDGPGSSTGIKVDGPALADAYREGEAIAKSLGPKDQVHCPYARGNPLRESWLDGFRAGGGVVE